jgi:hypothetical protein
VNGFGGETWLFIFHAKLSGVSCQLSAFGSLFSIVSFQFLVLGSQCLGFADG